jgi:hypothetical protein
MDSVSVFVFFLLQLLGAHYYSDIVGSLSSYYTDMSSMGNCIGSKINSWDYSYHYFKNVTVGLSSVDINSSTFYIVNNNKNYYCYGLDFNINSEMFDLRILAREDVPTYMINVVYPNYFIHYTPDYYYYQLVPHMDNMNGSILAEAYNYAMKSDFAVNFCHYVRFIVRNRMSMHFFYINDYYRNMLIFRRGCPLYSLGLTKEGLYGNYYNDIYTCIVKSCFL